MPLTSTESELRACFAQFGAVEKVEAPSVYVSASACFLWHQTRVAFHTRSHFIIVTCTRSGRSESDDTGSTFVTFVDVESFSQVLRAGTVKFTTRAGDVHVLRVTRAHAPALEALPASFIGHWQYDSKRENAGVSAADLEHLNAAREPLLQALDMPFVYRSVVLNARKSILHISAASLPYPITLCGQRTSAVWPAVQLHTHHYAGDLDTKFENVISEKFAPLKLNSNDEQAITMLDGSEATAVTAMEASNLKVTIMLPHVACTFFDWDVCLVSALENFSFYRRMDTAKSLMNIFSSACLYSPSAAFPLQHTYTVMDHNNALRLNVVFGDLNLNFYYLRVESEEY